MLIKCKNSDLGLIQDYIGNDFASCLYLYMDLVQYGPDSDYTSTWIQEREGKITCVILTYHTAMHIFARESFNTQEVFDLVDQLRPSQICAAKSTILALAQPLSTINYDSELGFVGKLESSGCPNSSIIQKATIDDVEAISHLLYNDEGIGASYSLEDLKAQFTERLSQGFVRSYIIKDGDRIVAHLGTGAEVGSVSIITYVITDTEYRGLGYAKILYQKASNDLQKEGKEIFAVYYTDGAIKLHHSVGFKDCCEFGKLFLKTH